MRQRFKTWEQQGSLWYELIKYQIQVQQDIATALKLEDQHIRNTSWKFLERKRKCYKCKFMCKYHTVNIWKLGKSQNACVLCETMQTQMLHKHKDIRCSISLLKCDLFNYRNNEQTPVKENKNVYKQNQYISVTSATILIDMKNA